MDETMLQGVLHVNASNTLLRRLRDLGPGHPHFSALLSILVANARMFAGQNLSAQDTIGCFEQINRSLSQLVNLSDRLEEGQRPLTTAILTDLGLHPDAAGRLCAVCETIDDLLTANLAQLAERVRVSPLMLATIREELASHEEPVSSSADHAVPAHPAVESAPGVIVPITELGKERRKVRRDKKEPLQQ